MMINAVKKKGIKKKVVRKKQDGVPRRAALRKTRKNTAMDLVSLVWDGSIRSYTSDLRGKGDCDWDKVNSAMYDAVNLAIRAGLYFGTCDFRTFEEKFEINHWAGRDRHMFGESLYANAVQSGNTNACISFEMWKNRKPFIYEGERIYVGREFTWKGKKVECTSFAEDGSYLIACSYRTERKSVHETPIPIDKQHFVPKSNWEENRKVDRRFKITYEDLRKKKKAD
jgi:hypothetical protein